MISPDHRLLAAPAELTLKATGGYERTRLYLLSLSPANRAPVAVPESIDSNKFAWTINGDWLLYDRDTPPNFSGFPAPRGVGAYKLGGTAHAMPIPYLGEVTMESIPQSHY